MAGRCSSVCCNSVLNVNYIYALYHQAIGCSEQIFLINPTATAFLMKKFFHNFYYSFPIQLLLLHFRKSQVLLILWLILFMTVSGIFMKSFGANTLFLAPEYLGNVNAAGAAITGVCTGIFMMSWNITTFILHSGRFRFLATSSKPFLKYCINNAIIPIAFLILYFIEAVYFDRVKELIPLEHFLFIVGGFLMGFFILIFVCGSNFI